MPSYRSYEKTCEICGGTYTAHRSDTRFCPKCRVNGTQKMMQKHRREVKYAERKQIEREKAQKREPRRCKFCGAMCVNEFCRDCYREGFNHVYSVTGRTNGLDKPMSARCNSRVSIKKKKDGDDPNAVVVGNNGKEVHHAD